ncbi:MAG: S8 family serine peptidase [Acidobacteriaceae bacterium]|nr:S8 family serine peptidase [Acidobacteriaceae bacterium]MBV9502883.1 S8 family serine peptidase [Acidobacteriaceae bacterium]
MERTAGRPEITLGLIDGPVALDHPDLANAAVRTAGGRAEAACARADAAACTHGTFVAGMLSARRGSTAPAICPECTLLLRPIFLDGDNLGQMPSATPQQLSEAIIETVGAGARVINLSAGMVRSSPRGEMRLQEALDYAAESGVLVIAAAGNQSQIGSSTITGHPWVIPVAACNNQAQPLTGSNLGTSIGKRGLSAPGKDITSLGSNGKTWRMSGTSVAAPFVTGAIALLWSEFPVASAAHIKFAITQGAGKRKSIAPPVLDARAAYESMKASL